MVDDQDRNYHRARAEAETALANRTQLPVAADAHRRLAALHLEKVRRADEPTEPPVISGARR